MSLRNVLLAVSASLLIGGHAFGGSYGSPTFQTFTVIDPTTTRAHLGLPPSATVDTTNANNISSGVLPAARLPTPTASTLGGVQSVLADPHQWLTSIDLSGVPHLAQPAASDISGLAASATTDTTNAGNIGSGTLPPARLPTPTASTLGGVESISGASHQWISGISTLGVPILSQPAYGDISGLGTAATLNAGAANGVPTLDSGALVPLAQLPGLAAQTGSVAASTVLVGPTSGSGAPTQRQLTVADVAGLSSTDTTDASNITSGTLPAARLPTPTASTLGGVKSAVPVTHQFMTGISTGGAPTLAQPAATDVTGLAASATTDATNASNISSGVLPAARLPTPGASTLGGVESSAGASHQFMTGISTGGAPTLAQPAASDISGLAPSATTDTTNASNIGSGTLPAAQMPAPTASTLGGVESSAGASHQWISGISTLGVPILSQPSYGDISGLGTAAEANTGTSGATVPLLSASNTFGPTQHFSDAAFSTGVLGSTSGTPPAAGYVGEVLSTTVAIGASTVTITKASPAVITCTECSLPNNSVVFLTTTGSLYTGLTANKNYYVVNATTNTLELSNTVGGTPINTSGSQSGTHTLTSGDSMTSAASTDTNIAPLPLTAGCWNISGEVWNTASGTTTTTILFGGLYTSATDDSHGPSLGGSNSSWSGSLAGGESNNIILSLPPWYQCFGSPTTVYLNGYAVFSGGTLSMQGKIQAQRIN